MGFQKYKKRFHFMDLTEIFFLGNEYQSISEDQKNYYNEGK